MEFAIKIYFNYGNNRSITLRTRHKKDFELLFGLPKHQNVMWGLAQIRDNIDSTFFEDEFPPDLQKEIPFVADQLQRGPMKVQAVVLPLLSFPLTNLINNKSLNQQDVLSFSKQMMCGIAHLHKHEFGHCDLKPDNLMIDESSKKLVIIDFGCASKFGTMPSGGNASHSPPEEDVPVDFGRDIFGAGCIIYTMLSGQHPFDNFDPTTWKWAEMKNPSFPLRKKN